MGLGVYGVCVCVCVCVFVCVCVYAFVCVCACVCVWKERESEQGRERGRVCLTPADATRQGGVCVGLSVYGAALASANSKEALVSPNLPTIRGMPIVIHDSLPQVTNSPILPSISPTRTTIKTSAPSSPLPLPAFAMWKAATDVQVGCVHKLGLRVVWHLDTHKTVKARFWPWLGGESPETFSRFPPLRLEAAPASRQRASISHTPCGATAVLWARFQAKRKISRLASRPTLRLHARPFVGVFTSQVLRDVVNSWR